MRVKWEMGILFFSGEKYDVVKLGRILAVVLGKESGFNGVKPNEQSDQCKWI